MDFKELYSIREWAPLTYINDQIPQRRKKGLVMMHLNITCVDAVEDFLALGSDAGIVFWYNKKKGQMQKLKPKKNAPITSVKIVDSVEYMVAAGNSEGQVSVFAIQKEQPAALNLIAPCTKIKPIERYTINDSHKSAITCCEWSKNAMKLYTGNLTGGVVLTELDYQAHVCKSVKILDEAHKIVQLSVHRGYLLVSTMYRSIVCHCNEARVSVKSDDWKVIQIGKQDCNQIAGCGGTFFKHPSFLSPSTKPRLVCGRPNFRLWLTDIKGNVEKTFVLDEAILKSPKYNIPILNPRDPSGNPPAVYQSNSFRRIYSYAGNDALIVTHDENSLYILNLQKLAVEASATGFRKIIDFCVWNKEIFVLEGGRSLIRLAPIPEKPNKTSKIIYNPSLPHPVPVLKFPMYNNLEAPVACEPEEQPIANADECFEFVHVKASDIPIELGVESSRAEQKRRIEAFKEISKMEFDHKILHHSETSKRGAVKKRNINPVKREEDIVQIGRTAVKYQKFGKPSNENTEEKGQLSTSYTLMDESFCTGDSNLSASYSEIITQLKEAQIDISPDDSSEKELDSPEVSPELRLTKFFSKPLSPERHSPPAPLVTVYPTENAFKNTSMQTIPPKEHLCRDEQDAYGEPIEDICRYIREARMYDIDDLIDCCENDIDIQHQSTTKEALQDLHIQPENVHDIDRFLSDFNKPEDYLRKSNDQVILSTQTTKKAEKAASEGSLSDWEILDKNK